jgi:hypothetical protein
MDHETAQPDNDTPEDMPDFDDEELTAGTYVLSTREPGTVSGGE